MSPKRATFLLFACIVSVAQAADKPVVKIAIYRAETKAAPGLTEVARPDTKDKIYLPKVPDITNDDIADARPAKDNRGMPAFEIILTDKGGKKMGKLTEEHNDKPLAILIDGKVVSVPVVRAKITQRAVVTGNFTQEEVEKIVKALKPGK
jgi:preprotein translocase subunit SecD